MTFARVPATAVRFSPSPWQLMALDALAGALAVTLATLLRFLDEGSVPATYAQRLLPWLLIAAVVQMVTGEVMTRLRRPGSPLASRPVAPFLVAALVGLVLVALVNDVLLREPLWHLPHFVSLFWPLLASAASAALRLAASRSIEVEELLTRPVVRLDVAACSAALAGKRVLITGAAGSIGAELTRQVLAVGPAEVLAVDTNETGLYELEGHAPGVRTCIADVADARRMRELCLRERPQIIFHAAAYKHVPLVEANPDQGFAINVMGTLAVCEAAVAAGAERVVVISTDKAVNPSSFMGLTKRVAELMVLALSQQASAWRHAEGEPSLAPSSSGRSAGLPLAERPESATTAAGGSSAAVARAVAASSAASMPADPAGNAAVASGSSLSAEGAALASSTPLGHSATRDERESGEAVPPSSTVLSAVRFGNVLGSRGSVVPTLLRQIEAGGPITITHPEAQRFFMTISEAASLVLLSAAYGEPGGLFVLDMGDEVRIEDLAERLIRLKGLRPGRDVAVRYVGLRPGEKLREELHTEEERLLATDRTGVWRVYADQAVDGNALLEGVRELDARRRAGALEPSAYPALLRELIARTTGNMEAVAVSR